MSNPNQHVQNNNDFRNQSLQLNLVLIQNYIVQEQRPCPEDPVVHRELNLEQWPSLLNFNKVNFLENLK